MPISVRCVCEKTLKVADKLAGKSVTCPACSTIISVPDLPQIEDPGFEVVEDFPAVEKRNESKLAVAKPVSKQRVIIDEDDEDDAPRRKRKRSSEYEDDDDDDRPRRRKKQVKNDGGFWSFEKGIMNGSVIGGALAMLGAVVWFVLGLVGNRIFFYPPILFIIGLIGVIRGLMNSGKE